MTDGSLDFGQRKDVFHQLCHFGACEIFDLRGKALNRAAQIAKTMGAFLPFAFLQIFLSVLKTVELVLLLCKLRLGSFLFGSTFRIVRPVNGQFFGIQLLCSVR